MSIRSWLCGVFVLVTVAATAHAGKPSDCSSKAWAAALQSAPIECETLVGKDTAGVHARVVQEKEKGGPDAKALAGEILASADTTLAAYRKLAPGLAFHDVTFALIHKPGVVASANLGLNSECVLYVFTDQDGFRNADKRAANTTFTVAHELVHCVQYWNYPKQSGADGRSWWIEGTADLLAHTVFEDKAGLMREYDNFVHGKTTALTSSGYASHVFWAWYAQKHGVAGVLAAWPRMATTNGDPPQRQALLQLVSLDALQGFATAFVDGKIATVRGWTFPAPSLERKASITSSTETKVATSPLTIVRGDVAVSGAEFSLATTGITPAPRFRVGDAWSPAPGRVGDACSQAEVPVPFATFVGDAKAEITIKATKLDASGKCGEQCKPFKQLDACLAGNWAINDVATSHVLDEGLRSVGQFGKKDGSALNGDLTLSLDPKGAGSLVYTDLEIAAHTHDPASNIVVTAKGKRTGTWSTDKNTLRFCASEDTTSVEARVKLFLPADDGSVATPEHTQKFATNSNQTDWSYMCTPIGLRVVPMPPQAIGKVPVVYWFKRAK